MLPPYRTCEAFRFLPAVHFDRRPSDGNPYEHATYQLRSFAKKSRFERFRGFDLVHNPVCSVVKCCESGQSLWITGGYVVCGSELRSGITRTWKFTVAIDDEFARCRL